MVESALRARRAAIPARHVPCFVRCGDGQQMSQRAHFWLRVVGLAVILVAEFGPRLWTSGADTSPSRVAAAIDAR